MKSLSVGPVQSGVVFGAIPGIYRPSQYFENYFYSFFVFWLFRSSLKKHSPSAVFRCEGCLWEDVIRVIEGLAS